MAVFVQCESTSSPPGLGKLVSVSGSLATVEYFHSPVDDPVVVTLSTSSLRKVEVAPQTRAYWFDTTLHAWRVGRILDGEGDRFAVRFPNGDERLLSAVDLQIRWDKPIVDPAPFLAQFLCETPLFADARSGFVRALMEQRGASLGMSALLSSGIEIEAHQVEVVRRVLQDPVQRYLLADEVGLGKTIEAGVLIRQYVIDDPDDHRVLVLVPPSLVAQWTHELRRRYFLPVDASDGRVRVISTADLAAVETALPGAGMLVLDEAHHLSADQRLYKLVRQVAATVPRLLLLSATPVLRNERGFLEMLHLLDPLVYPLDDADAFRRRIQHRQSLAEAVAALIPENVLQLDAFLDSLAERFANDPILVDRMATLRRVAAALPTEDDPELLQALAEVRAHLSEIYRLDHRILRPSCGRPSITHCASLGMSGVEAFIRLSSIKL
jgi:ATP-dependent helicase HepA